LPKTLKTAKIKALMISSIKGKVKTTTNRAIIVEVGGLGYQVFVSPIIINKFKSGQEVEFFTYLHVRENAMELYGFLSTGELEFFSQLIDISGIGPKTALNVLALSKVDDIKRAIQANDASILTKVSGIGRKTAERIILELKNKFENLVTVDAGGNDAEVIDALVGLGYRVNEAREAVRRVSPQVTDTQVRIKEALKNIQ
jgi:Holliday junction DNA helicase RuvA